MTIHVCVAQAMRRVLWLVFATIMFVAFWEKGMDSHAHAAEEGFLIVVPCKDPGGTCGGGYPLSKLKVTVSVETESAVTFNVKNSSSSSGTLEFAAVSPGSAPSSNSFTKPTTDGAGNDVVRINPLDATAMGTNPPPLNDPARKKYVLLFNLESDRKQVGSNNCANAMTIDETWTVKVKTGSPKITGVFVQSMDQNVTGSECAANRVVPLGGKMATVTKLDGTPLPDELQGGRPGVDAVLVLDRSGSMFDTVTGAPGEKQKMKSLHDAVENFTKVWAFLRQNEVAGSPGSPVIQPVPDRVGVVFFDHAISWLKGLIPLSAIDGIKPIGSTTSVVTGPGFSCPARPSPATTDVLEDIACKSAEVDPNGATSIGGGLDMAADALAPLAGNGNRKVVMLMTDGMQNTEPMAEVVGGQVRITRSGMSPKPLANQDTLQIYSLTVGTGAVTDPTINKALADATHGDYKNSETDASILPTFFLEVLQNFIKFSTVETLRMVSSSARRGVPYQATIPVTTTSQSLTFNLTWNPDRGFLQVIVQPPGDVEPIRMPDDDDSGTPGVLVFNTLLPLEGQRSSAGDWTVRVEATGQEVPEDIPFNLIVLGDDAAINSTLATVSADYAVGDKIRLRARVNALEEPVKGLNVQPSGRMIAQLVKPGISIGDLLSTSTASTTVPTSPDPMGLVEARLKNILAKDPNALAPRQDTITLVDDGDASHGDDVAGDGVYSALYPAPLEGHYNFLFGVEGNSPVVGKFSRQQLRTVHVRVVPDAGSTLFNTAVQTGDGRNVLTIHMTPGTSTGHRMGPGWANYFWFTAPSGPPFKAVDNLNGTYTATLNFSGTTPPVVKAHFLRVASKITDATTPDQLPIPLDDKTVFEPDVLHPKSDKCGCFDIGCFIKKAFR